MKILIILISLIVISCGSSSSSSTKESDSLDQPPVELPSDFKVIYKVYLEDPSICGGYNVYINFLNDNEQLESQNFHLSKTWQFTFYHNRTFSRSFEIEVNRQGNLTCSPIHVELYIDGELMDEKIGAIPNEFLNTDYYFQAE